QCLDFLRRQRALDPAELDAVLVTGMRADLDAELRAAPRRGDGHGHRSGVRTARDVGAVDEAEDRLFMDAALAEVGVEVHSCFVSPRKSASACERTGITASSDSIAPLGLPGTLITSVWPRTPARPRVSAAIGVLSSPARRISSVSPGTSYSITDAVACGVTSRGPSPVPPVVITRLLPPSD